MPAYTRGKKRENLVYVDINQYCFFLFKSKDLSSLSGISTSDVTALGHKTEASVSADTTRIRIIGASAPKPPRATKKLSNAAAGTQQSASTFCGYSSIATAQVAGWKITKTRRSVSLRAASALRGSLTAIAELSDGSHYCFPMNKADFDSYGASLGLKTAVTITTATELGKLVAGSSIPRPGKASIELATGSSFSSFYSSDKRSDAASAGFSIMSEEIVLKAANAPDAP
jgi:hypothetical protein